MGSKSESDDGSEMGMAELDMDFVEVNEGIPETTDGDPKRVASVEVNERILHTSVKAGGTGSSMVWNMDPIVLLGGKKISVGIVRRYFLIKVVVQQLIK
ncbi:hypothetical protein LIER_14154 [Lithospermum erythrorhizon]|uniref:Uncharacterized protein n=1 Tax=Lithospermum erythrorhizon TaxID=34254 RepID=A0AAV3Q0C2_LITER